jgi:tetratricopeptide (TPR) repeat protein
MDPIMSLFMNPSPAAMSSLRFAVGTKVLCQMEAWTKGEVVMLRYREDDWPPGLVAAYQVRLDNGGLVYASEDSDTFIRKQEEQNPSKIRDATEGEDNTTTTEGIGAAAEEVAKTDNGKEVCAICMESVVDPVKLPCLHSYCRLCIIGLRRHGVTDTCPVCRTELPAGAAELCDEATRLVVRAERLVDKKESSKLRTLAISKLLQAHEFDPYYQRAQDLLTAFSFEETMGLPKSEDNDCMSTMPFPSEDIEATKLCFRAVNLINAVEHYTGVEKEGALADAERLLSQALEKDPQYAMAHMNLGMVCRAKSDPEGEIEHYKRGLLYEQRHASLHFLLGNALASIGDHGSAVNAYKGALKIDEKDTFVLFNLANSLGSLGDSAQAEEMRKRALGVDPEFIPVLLAQACDRLREGDADGTLQLCNDILARDPHNFSAHMTMGSAFTIKKQFHEAITSFLTAKEIKPTNVIAYSELAGVQTDIGDLNSARETYAAGAALPLSDFAHQMTIETQANCAFNESAIHGMMGNHFAVINSLHRAVEISPGYFKAHLALGRALSKIGRFDEAAASLRAASTIMPDRPEPMVDQGWLLLNQKDFVGAKTAFESARSAAVALGDNETLEHIAKCLDAIMNKIIANQIQEDSIGDSRST